MKPYILFTEKPWPLRRLFTQLSMVLHKWEYILLSQLVLIVAIPYYREIDKSLDTSPPAAAVTKPLKPQVYPSNLRTTTKNPNSEAHLLLSDYNIAKENTEWFTEHLRTYLNGLEFDRADFDREQKFLGDHLLAISNFTNKHFPHSKPLMSMLNFANRTFLAFQHASDLLLGLCQGGTALSLTRYSIHLNIGLLRYFDNYGEPDPWYPGYAERILEFTQTLASWVKIFDLLDDVPQHVDLVFRAKILEAQNTLLVLADHRWKSEIPMPNIEMKYSRSPLPPGVEMFAAAWNVAIAVDSLMTNRGNSRLSW